MLNAPRILILTAVMLTVGCSQFQVSLVKPPKVVQTPKVIVVPSDSDFQKVEIFSEVIPQDNCGGTSEAIQRLARSYTIESKVNMGGEITVDAEGGADVYGVGYVGVGAAVAAHYGVEYGSMHESTTEVEIRAASRTRVEHELIHYELRDSGTVVTTSGSVIDQQSYQFPREYRVEVKTTELACPTDVKNPPVRDVTPDPVAVVPTATPAATYTPESVATFTPTTPPTPTSTSVPIIIPVEPLRFISNTEIPEGTTYRVDVDLNEIHFWTAGPVCVAGRCLEGGYARGSIIVMRSREQAFSLELSNLVPHSNWHGGFRADPQSWAQLTSEAVERMKMPNNCGTGIGCEVVDVIVVEDGQVIEQYQR